MPWSCFSYPASTGPRRPTTSHYFSYPAEVPRRMPLPCFSYQNDAPLSALPRLRTMTNSACFRY